MAITFDKKEIEAQCEEFFSLYDVTKGNVYDMCKLKIIHTRAVAQNCYNIAKRLPGDGVLVTFFPISLHKGSQSIKREKSRNRNQLQKHMKDSSRKRNITLLVRLLKQAAATKRTKSGAYKKKRNKHNHA